MIASKRTVIVGKNSKLWRSLAADPRLQGCIAIGHADIGEFAFAHSDQVWILSYSRYMDDNRRLLETLAASQARHFVYVSTATANVDAVTNCYEYPRVKRASEDLSRSTLGASVVSIGVVYHDLADLPAGTTMATSLDQFAALIAGPDLPNGSRTNLFSPIKRPFGSRIERLAFHLYGHMQKIAAPWPCMLRPLDIVLRTLGWRWYGYLYLSNRLWLTTTS